MNLKVLQKLINKHNLNDLSTEKLLANFADIYKRHNVMVSNVTNTVNESFAGTNTFIDCPECGSKTMLGFGECHICGENLFDSITDENAETEVKPKKETKVKKAETKAPKKEDPAAPIELSKEGKLEEDDDFDLDMDLDEEIVEEKPKKEKKPAKEEVEVTEDDLDDFDDNESIDDLMEESESKKEDDDDLDFDLDDEDLDLDLD